MYLKITLILAIVFLGLSSPIIHTLYSQDTGFKYFKNYNYKEYDHQAQNWGMVQDKNGIIYAANHGGVLEFDGVSWRVIEVPNYTVRSLAMDEQGRIYIGGNNELGYLEPDAKGALSYQSLRDRVKNKGINFSYVWGTHSTKQGIYFRTLKFLFRWDSRHLEIWKPGNPIYGSYACKGELFIYQGNRGLMKMKSDSLQSIPGGEAFAKVKKIFMMVPYDSQRLLIGTRPKGFFIYDGKKMMPFPTEADEYLKEKKVYHGIRLANGDLALATLHGGLVIMNHHGHLEYILDRNSGLQGDDVKYVFEDKQGNLWLCLDKGISKIEYASPISIHDERSNLAGIVLSVVKHHDDLYVGTTNGIYYLESPLNFRLIPGISGSCWSLLSIGESVLAATSRGVFHVKKNISRRVIKDLSFVLSASKRYPGGAWCGTDTGLKTLIQKDNRWLEGYRFKPIDKEIRAIAEDKNGNLWLGTSPGGVVKVDFPDNTELRQPAVTPYGPSQGIHDGPVYTTFAAGHIMFATGKGIFQFDEKKKVFIPDFTLGREFAGGPHSKAVFRIVEDKNKNIWFHSASRNYRAIPAPGGIFTIYSQPFHRIPLIQVNGIYPGPDGKATWFASFDGLIRFDTTIKKNYQQDFQALVRKVFVNETLIFDGFKNKTAKLDKGLFPIFEYEDRNLYFEFAAPFFEAETETQYRCLLEGYDNNWSTWSKDTKRNYTNLDSGLYTFRVRAKNVYGTLSQEAIFQFKVLPPWYLTWWAFLSYAIIFILVVLVIVKWRSRRLEQEKQKLEYIIKERTKEINDKNLQLEKQTFTLKDQSEKLKEMDKVKSRFFTNISHEFRTPLTLIMGPLEQMHSDSRDKKQTDKLNVMIRNSQRLLTLINQLLDLSRLDSGKMKLKTARQNIVPFLKGTMASFHMLALKNKLELEFHSEKEDISLYFDAQKMEEVMYNLLINAVKFTPPGGRITVSVSMDQGTPPKKGSLSPGFVKISMQDTGVGIPKDELAYIFDRFYQAESLKGKGHKGTGIGLALSKEIVILHQGKIDVHSQEGKGTEFAVRLPLGAEHLKPGEITPSPEISPTGKKSKEVETLYLAVEEEVKREPGEGDEDKTGKREKNVILVVEDHADVRKYIRDPLEKFYTVVEACDGKEGTAKAKEIIPDLIVSDIMMPEMDGYELCRVLKKDINTSHIPIILLTAKASEESVIRGLETGADDYVTKPFNSKILLTRIKNLIDLRRQLQLKIQRQKMLLPDEIPVSSMDETFLKEFQDIINKNLSDEDFNIDVLCQKLYMGRSTLFRKIQALTGETPNQFILSYRLERAAQLLRENYGNVTEVAMAVGFSSPPYFAKCFKEKFHQSPSSFQASESKSS